ncbi:hypothetical protein K458DRAFT_461499 [Lentithecium fluviatile CBS 122367]|uniref:Uncharacterized protein n=1 Tax=Lentithecium fluviatile CBS 122367 TaxID=1168545 RepID=A0A6G1ILG2_9PLEO|nr:hypothetical protein K458DRAFT_461499 [Lentithecium fluviatile CBS 122367]
MLSNVLKTSTWLLLLSIHPSLTLSLPRFFKAHLSRQSNPCPSCPGPPAADPPSPPGDGSGDWGKGGTPTWRDKTWKVVVLTAATGAKGLGLYHAGENLIHFLDNTGTDKYNSPDHILFELKDFNQEVADLVQPLAASAYTAAKSAGGGTQTFASRWTVCNLQGSSRSTDWFLALGGFNFAVSGFVTVKKVSATEWNGDLTYVVHIFDRYNWDGKKIAMFDVTIFEDDWMGKLHKIGLAREYIVRGTSENTYGVSGYDGGQVPKPQAPATED